VLAINVLAISVLAIDVLAIAPGLRNGGRTGRGRRACSCLADQDRRARAATLSTEPGPAPSSVSNPDHSFTHLCRKHTFELVARRVVDDHGTTGSTQGAATLPSIQEIMFWMAITGGSWRDCESASSDVG
jgi:hypothetical protein